MYYIDSILIYNVLSVIAPFFIDNLLGFIYYFFKGERKRERERESITSHTSTRVEREDLHFYSIDSS